MYASEGIRAPLRVKLCNAWSIPYSQILEVISWVFTDESAVKVEGMWYRPCGKRSQVLNDVWWNTWWLWTGRTGRRFLGPPSTETWPLLFLSVLQVCALTFWISKVGSFEPNPLYACQRLVHLKLTPYMQEAKMWLKACFKVTFLKVVFFRCTWN